ncbi:hypothetical protein NM63023_2267 [Neisseria meningitidis 63023]|nr:hypothetical protein NM63023_2267 [Neisseria meningitidis 63023]
MYGQGAVEFGNGVRTQTQAQTGGGDGGKVGGVHVFLSEMHAVRACFDCLAPVVIDEKLRMAALTGCGAAGDFAFQFIAVQGLAAQLHRVGTCFDHALDPIGGGDDGVEFERGFEWQEGHGVPFRRL